MQFHLSPVHRHRSNFFYQAVINMSFIFLYCANAEPNMQAIWSSSTHVLIKVPGWGEAIRDVDTRVPGSYLMLISVSIALLTIHRKSKVDDARLS
jgi:hypothetical protein